MKTLEERLKLVKPIKDVQYFFFLQRVEKFLDDIFGDKFENKSNAK